MKYANFGNLTFFKSDSRKGNVESRKEYFPFMIERIKFPF
jgi:hypothetical protein